MPVIQLEVSPWCNDLACIINNFNIGILASCSPCTISCIYKQGLDIKITYNFSVIGERNIISNVCIWRLLSLGMGSCVINNNGQSVDTTNFALAGYSFKRLIYGIN